MGGGVKVWGGGGGGGGVSTPFRTMDKADIIEIVSTFIKSLRRPNVFKNNIPGDNWVSLFQKRWKKELSARKPEILTLLCAISCNEQVVNAYFTVLEDLLIKLDLKERPDHILNLDESRFVTDPKVERIFVKRGKKDPVTVIPGSGREMYTVLSCVSASGHVYPPFMLFKVRTCTSTSAMVAPPGTGYGATDSG